MDYFYNTIVNVGSLFLTLALALHRVARQFIDYFSYTVESTKCTSKGPVTTNGLSFPSKGRVLATKCLRMLRGSRTPSTSASIELKSRAQCYRAFMQGDSDIIRSTISDWLARVCRNDDLSGEYWVALVFKKEGWVPFFRKSHLMLSCRYFSEPDDIRSHLGKERRKWDPQAIAKKRTVLTEELPHDGELECSVCIDRLGDRTRREWRDTVIAHAAAFNRVLIDTKAKVVYAIARQSEEEVLLTKYLAAGLEIVGTCISQIGDTWPEYKFWILRGEVKRMRDFADALTLLGKWAFRGIQQR